MLSPTNEEAVRIYNDTDTSYNNLELPGVNITDVAVREDGLVCIGTLNAGFTYLTDTLVRVYNTAEDMLPDNTALGVALDSQGEFLYVVSNNNARIYKYDSAGNFVTGWGQRGTGEGQFVRPIYVAVDVEGNVYVSDDRNPVIQKFDSEGQLLARAASWNPDRRCDGVSLRSLALGDRARSRARILARASRALRLVPASSRTPGPRCRGVTRAFARTHRDHRSDRARDDRSRASLART